MQTVPDLVAVVLIEEVVETVEAVVEAAEVVAKPMMMVDLAGSGKTMPVESDHYIYYHKKKYHL